MSKTFGLIGASGFVGVRHIKAIYETKNELVAALDPFDSIGIIDKYFPKADFFTTIERFDRYLYKKKNSNDKVDIISVCSPNFLHDSHIRFALRSGCEVICEKPVVINPWNFKLIKKTIKEYNKNVFAILQLRHHPNAIKLKKAVKKTKKKFDVDLTYIAGRGNWYFSSWKGDEEKSGGILMNIGIHFFDLLEWIFGKVEDTTVHIREKDVAAGYLEYKSARVRWFLSLRFEHLANKSSNTHKELIINNKKIDLNEGFENLHTLSYKKILQNKGFKITEAESSIRTVFKLRQEKLSFAKNDYHPLIKEIMK